VNSLIDGLVLFIAFIGLVVLHEFAHAWVAVRCGDDTPRLQHRLTLDPLAHIEWIGTIILPLIVTVISAMGGSAMLFGWGRPVQVNLNNFRHRRRDDILVSAAGPAMNLIAAVAILALTKAIEAAGIGSFTETGWDIARLSLFLCFFNLLPIPPLDGGHIVRNLIGMSDEAYAQISRYSFMFLLMVWRVPAVQTFVSVYTESVFVMMAWPFGWRFTFTI
jgi:Zn-dependent protease